MLATALVSAQPTIGPFSTGFVTLENEALDDTNHEVLMVYPSNGTAGQLFPLIAYAHGAAGGNFDINGYDIFFHQLASFGYVIAAHKSCSVGT
jgi:predicted dienelactone hydrolase